MKINSASVGLCVFLSLGLSPAFTLPPETGKDKSRPGPDTFGYVAEWEYTGQRRVPDSIDEPFGTTESPSLKDADAGKLYPSKRVGPGTWLDSNGSWWLFGGQGPNLYNPSPASGPAPTEFLSDLWVFDSTSTWRPIFRPYPNSESPISSFPDYLAFPSLCGSSAHGHVALFGGDSAANSPYTSIESSDSLLSEDNVVWLYDVDTGRPEDSGLWTSYICCDACLPDENTTLQFCPHFSEPEPESKVRDPIIWCSAEALMALQFSTPEPRLPKVTSPDQINSLPLTDKSGLNWWKFDLGATEWEKMPGVQISLRAPVVEPELFFRPDCRHVSDSLYVYILCPSGGPNRLQRDVYVFDPSVPEVSWAATMRLNNAFQDGRVWELGRSVLSAVRHGNHTVLLLAYHKLLDLWLLDHSARRISPVENLWKGASLHLFQHTSSFYKLGLSFPDGGRQRVYMPNPRSKLFEFWDPEPGAEFGIRLQRDTDVFLPARDAPFLLSPSPGPAREELAQKDQMDIEPKKSSPEPPKSPNVITGTGEPELKTNLPPDPPFNSKQGPPNSYRDSSSLGSQSIDLATTSEPELAGTVSKGTAKTTVAESKGTARTLGPITSSTIPAYGPAKPVTSSPMSSPGRQNKSLTSSPTFTPGSQNQPVTSGPIPAYRPDKPVTSSPISTPGPQNKPVTSGPISTPGPQNKPVTSGPSSAYWSSSLPTGKMTRRFGFKTHTKRENSASERQESPSGAVVYFAREVKPEVTEEGAAEPELAKDPLSLEGAEEGSAEVGAREGSLGPGPQTSAFGPLLFFTLSISFFAGFGLVVFVRRCVKCPHRRQSVLLKEPPPIRYSVIPDELGFSYNHTPIV